MTYVKPMVIIFDEEIMKEIEAAARSSCQFYNPYILSNYLIIL